MSRGTRRFRVPRSEKLGITRITVSGYKSIAKEQSIEIRPLTILAGANSSGKSSMLQPLLLLKQTLEIGYDPGALLIDGTNVKFTSTSQLLSRAGKGTLLVDIELFGSPHIKLEFEPHEGSGLVVQKMTMGTEKNEVVLEYGMTERELSHIIRKDARKGILDMYPKMTVVRERCFLRVLLHVEDESESHEVSLSPPLAFLLRSTVVDPESLEAEIRRMIHLPGLRGNPERMYPKSATGPNFPGTFENYTASVIAEWQSSKREDKLKALWDDLKKLGLTWKVTAKPVDDTRVSLQVGRLCSPSDKDNDLVDISDVGFGTSQTLPVLVALHAAEPGQLVFIEQPETHIHPRAQFLLAEVLAAASKRGVKVVVETHSALLLLGVQASVARGKISNNLVKLHWFQRSRDGCTEIASADLDEAGTFGDWPADFGKVQLDAHDIYLDASESKKGE